MDVKDLRSWDSVKREFKLTDLLAIIAVLVLLVFLIMPVQIGQKGGSKKSICISNMKQIGTAFLIYCADNNDFYPSGGHGTVKIGDRPPDPEEEQDGGSEQDWTVVIQPYVKNPGILRCPLDTSLQPKASENPDESREYLTSYTVNGWAEYDLAVTAVSHLSNWVLLAERNNVVQSPNSGWKFDWWLWQGNVWPPALSPDPTPKASEDLDLKRHSDTSNWLFGDTHAKNRRFPELWKAGSDNAFWPHGK